MKTVILVIVSATISFFAGCQQQTDSKDRGTYAAARHSTVGSNIPQRQAVDSTSSTYNPDQFANQQNQLSNLNHGLSGSGR